MNAVETRVGDLVAAFLERCGLATAFGVISIHNMPILDAIGRRNSLRFVPSRGEAGAVNMADAFARVTGGLGVAVTSTGTGAGNAAGALVEAQTAGSPVLHLTGQVDSPYLDRGRSVIHEAAAQTEMLRAVSKASYRIWSAETALGVLREAVRVALTPPRGPVSVELPIDIQKAAAVLPGESVAPVVIAAQAPDAAAFDRIVERLAAARRPLVWLGGGARHAARAALKLADLGVGFVTSVNGRGTVPEDHPMTLGAFNMSPSVEAFYRTCDAMLVVGSRLRGNETRNFAVALPKPLLQVDVDPRAEGRAYPTEAFACADAGLALVALADRLKGRLRIDDEFGRDLAAARAAAEAAMRDGLGPYARLVAELRAGMPRDALWVRDITISNSTWGNRLLKIFDPRAGVHALGGGIGQCVPMAVGAALAARDRKVIALTGDGGLALCLAELATAVQERCDITFLVMNDRGYGVIRNIQDAQYGGRHFYTDVFAPDLADLARAMKLPHARVDNLDEFTSSLRTAVGTDGPYLLEIDMPAIGPFTSKFAGPPVAKPNS